MKGGHTLGEWADLWATDIAKVGVEANLIVGGEMHGTVALSRCMKLRLLHDSPTETTPPQFLSYDNCI